MSVRIHNIESEIARYELHLERHPNAQCNKNVIANIERLRRVQIEIAGWQSVSSSYVFVD